MLKDCISDKPVTFKIYKEILDKEFPLIRHWWEGDFKKFLGNFTHFPDSTYNINTWKEFKDKFSLEKYKYEFIRVDDCLEEGIWFITPIGQLQILQEILRMNLIEQEKKLVKIRQIDTTTDPFHFIDDKTYVEIDKLTDNYTFTIKD